jgi:hypothetical protein
MPALSGGASVSGRYLSDMSRWVRHTRQWIWLQGNFPPSVVPEIPTYGPRLQSGPSVSPGARSYAISAVDDFGNLLIWGGDAGASLFADLFSFSTSSLRWTFQAGTSATNGPATYLTPKGSPVLGNSTAPGARHWAAGWWSNHRFWRFGGIGPSITHNDLYVLQ